LITRLPKEFELPWVIIELECVRLQINWVTILLLGYIGHSAGLCGSTDLKLKCSLPHASAVISIVRRKLYSEWRG
jgi:hypothetical protein